MKVIKVGTGAQNRIAQACDRCRSKKIRCDGTTPCCSQCANVGFECKTSDKLSRRAFPRGYTESLEERVRVLEAEVKGLRALLDEKDETLDMLSKLQLHAPSKGRSPINLDAASTGQPARDTKTIDFAVATTQQLSNLQGPGKEKTPGMGDSRGETFIGMYRKHNGLRVTATKKRHRGIQQCCHRIRKDMSYISSKHLFRTSSYVFRTIKAVLRSHRPKATSLSIV